MRPRPPPGLARYARPPPTSGHGAVGRVLRTRVDPRRHGTRSGRRPNLLRRSQATLYRLSSLRSDGLGRWEPVISTPHHATDISARGWAGSGAGAMSGVLRRVND